MDLYLFMFIKSDAHPEFVLFLSVFIALDLLYFLIKKKGILTSFNGSLANFDERYVQIKSNIYKQLTSHEPQLLSSINTIYFFLS